MLKSFARKCLTLQKTRYLKKKFAQKLRRPFDPARARRFLCFQMNAIGDVIMTYPAWSALKSAMPDATIDLVCRPHIAPLFRLDPLLDHIYPFEPRKYRSWLFEDSNRLADLMSRGGYDLLIDFTALPLTAAVCAASATTPSLGFSRRISLSKQGTELGQAFDITFPFSDEMPLRELMLRLVMPLSDSMTDSKAPRILLADETLKKAEDTLNSVEIDSQKFIVIHPGAKWPPKRWPTRHWISLIRALKEGFLPPVIVLGGPADESIIQDITTAHEDHEVKTVITDEINVAAAIIKMAAVCVCNDSAPMHIAAAVGTPSIALFGPVSPNRSAPPLKTHCSVLYEAMFCSPCRLYYAKNRCRRGFNFCMHAISPERVLMEIKKIMSSQRREA